MFDYAIGHYQKHPPSRRLLASWAASILSHALAIIILYEYPQLLQSGRYLWIQQIQPIKASEKLTRNLGVSATMKLPPMEELKKYLPDWNQGRTKESEQPPIVVNLPRMVIDDIPAPLPKPRLDAPVPARPSAPPQTLPVTPKPPLTADEIAGMTKKPGTPGASAGTPTQIPKGISDPQPPSKGTGSGASGSNQVKPGGGTDNPNQQITGIGFESDAKGVNLQDYGLLVKELIKAKWEIPTNLRDYQGSVTIIFTIHKDGTVTGAKIYAASGNETLDLTALTAVYQSSPLPVLPGAFPSDRLGAKLVFAYNERK